MKEISDFFMGLFATDKWPARWNCGEWSGFHGWLYIISDLLIWLAYFLIPVIIIRYFTGKKKLIKFSRVYVLFATFILLCGSTHFIDATMFWWPMYRFNALVRLATAVVSLFTVYHLFKILPQAFKEKTNMELELEIARRTEVEKKLEEANSNLQGFASMASHDLQEPLRKMTLYTTMLFQTNQDRFDAKTMEIVNKVVSSSARMQRIIEDVLNLSSIQIDQHFTNVNLGETVETALDDLEMKIAETKTVVSYKGLPAVRGNKKYLTQMFMNLINNAIKFCNTTPQIDITGSIIGDKCVIKIKDNGIGMDEKDVEKIFVAFQRLHSRSKYEGSGLGLAICKRIVDLHNGTISVASKPGQGTAFIIELPAGT